MNNLLFPEQARETSLNILIIEDNPGDIIIVNELLRNAGTPFILTKSSNLKESVVLLNESKFDVVLLDLGLPESTGVETLKEFLAFKFPSPVVVMTGLDDEEIALTSLREGAQDYLVKNRLNAENIIRSIKYSIERKKLQDLQKKSTHQLSVLSSTTAELFAGDDVSSIYSIICESIKKLMDNAITLSIEFDKNQLLHISNNDNFKLWAEKIASLTGLDLITRIEQRKDEFLNLFSDGKINQIKGGLYEILGLKDVPEKYKEIEKRMGLYNTSTIGFLRNENYYGGIIIFTRNVIEDDTSKIIENLSSQASLSIYRRIIKKNLILSEARYQKLTEELEEKVRKRTRELEIANIKLNRELKVRAKAEAALKKSEAQLLELNATKDKFFNIVAHDLKNPFTSLLGATELLFDNIQDMDKEKIKKLAQILNESAKSGYSILLNLLDWSRSQTGLIKMNVQKVNLKKLLDDNIADMHLNSTEKKISIVSELIDDMYIMADVNMLNTILRNLLSNALKFTNKGGKITVKAELKNSEVILSVKDNGIGISEEHLDKLFRIDTKYTRPGTDKELGTGLGLKLSKEFVEKLGGRIWAQSTENKGSEFTFSIPFIIPKPI